jgi:hypothetical protein
MLIRFIHGKHSGRELVFLREEAFFWHNYPMPRLADFREQVCAVTGQGDGNPIN